jgi:hypothetical protein
MKNPVIRDTDKYIVLEGHKHGNCFMTMHTPGDTHEGYNVLGTALTNQDGLDIISTHTGRNDNERLGDYLFGMTMDMNQKCKDAGMSPLW